jgi:hypothetical protein
MYSIYSKESAVVVQIQSLLGGAAPECSCFLMLEGCQAAVAVTWDDPT